MSYDRAFPEPWFAMLRTDGVWRTDPWNNLVTIYRFCTDLRVITTSVPGGRLLDTVATWFVPNENRVDDGRTVYHFGFGTFGFDDPYVIAEWPSLSRGDIADRWWSRGSVAGAVLTWEFTRWTGRQRPPDFRPPAVNEQARFHVVDGW